MRRVIVPALMIMALLLCGCGESDRLEKGFDEAREKWRAAEELSFTADVTAELYESSFECSLLCTRSGDETLVEVLAPENISGIKARLKKGEAQIEFDNIILAIGDPMKGEVSPLGAVALIMSALLESPASQFWKEKQQERDLAVTELYISENQYARLWFLKENYSLVHAELVSDGRAVVKCKIVDFTKE